jgi:hypothetical protein
MQLRAILIFFSAICGYALFGQNVKKLKVLSIQKDSCCTYEITLKNESDSIVCILHSLYVNLTSGIPQGLALYQKNEYKDSYSLHYALKDTLYDFDPPAYKGELILPYQILRFKVKTAFVEKKIVNLSFECFYLNDLCYKDFLKDMKQVGLWFTKYKRVEKIIELAR